jgi:addiction module HigA family antidote
MSDLRRNRRPMHPGTILREHYLLPRKVSVTSLAAATGLSRKHTSQIINGHKRIEPVTAARLGLVLGTTTRFWLNLQAAVDAWDAEQEVTTWQPTISFNPPGVPS